MKLFLGIDTSNYTTSLALFGEDGKPVNQIRKLLPVKEGELGLRQSDAVFHHTQAIPQLFRELMTGLDGKKIAAVGCSSRPRPVEGSYMPCFSVGTGAADTISSLLGCPFYHFSHQEGHIAAAAYGAAFHPVDDEPFFAFHLSGGTTDLLRVVSGQNGMTVEQIGGSDDLHAGQAVDRVGAALGIPFPAGAELEKLAAKAAQKPKGFSVSVKGLSCQLSGLENLAKKRIADGFSPEDTAAFTFAYLEKTLLRLIKNAKEQYGDLPFLFAGGVMSSRLMRPALSSACRAYFADGTYSADNACGIALLTRRAYERNRS